MTRAGSPKATPPSGTPVPTNADAAEVFREIADLLDLLGEKFKPEAYRRAARSIESLTEDLSKVAARNELRAIPGVGDAIEEKIRELLATGRVAYHDRLAREVPPGLLELVRLPGLGPKTARLFWTDLGVEGPAELQAAIDAGKLEGRKGFGAKKISQIRAALAPAPVGESTGRRPIEAAYPVAMGLLRALRARAPVERGEIAGSFRRGRETVGDLDVLVTSDDPGAVFDAFSALPEVREVRLRGGTKETVLLTGGLQVDLRVVEPEAFGAALQYFTGSKDHNVRLRSLARDRGLKVNEYGVFRGDERIAGRTEEDVYAALGLAWIPPELREDQGEIDLAAEGKVPQLVESKDLLGDLHIHLTTETTGADVDRIVADARVRHYAYVGFVVAGIAEDGMLFRASADVRRRLGEAGGRGLRVLQAIEVPPGPLPISLISEKPDYWIYRPRGAPPSVGASWELENVRLLAHLSAGEDGSDGPLRAWLDALHARSIAVEIGPGPDRIDSRAARLARSLEVPLAIPTGIGTEADDPTLPVALAFARRAGAIAHDVANALEFPAKDPRSARPRRPY
jgi:DNA polymerase/3'-5' exonuclease PolX